LAIEWLVERAFKPATSAFAPTFSWLTHLRKRSESLSTAGDTSTRLAQIENFFRESFNAVAGDRDLLRLGSDPDAHTF
jgi:hypothetical protein